MMEVAVMSRMDLVMSKEALVVSKEDLVEKAVVLKEDPVVLKEDPVQEAVVVEKHRNKHAVDIMDVEDLV